MFDYLFRFETEAEALTALAGTEWVGLGESNQAVFRASRPGSSIWRTEPILAEAVWDNTDPDNPVLTSMQITSDDFWLLLATPAHDPSIHNLPGWVHATDRQLAINNASLPPEQQFYFIIDTILLPEEMNAVIRLTNMPAGSNYPFGAAP